MWCGMWLWCDMMWCDVVVVWCGVMWAVSTSIVVVGLKTVNRAERWGTVQWVGAVRYKGSGWQSQSSGETLLPISHSGYQAGPLLSPGGFVSRPPVGELTATVGPLRLRKGPSLWPGRKTEKGSCKSLCCIHQIPNYLPPGAFLWE